ncbi:MAG: SusD/RagB family nutrient-binding outer membrane lipoprotein [Marinilabiliales bacterium]|nr:SusD/RagB family nutrient-binding outer membrane lipoprotein [Marinilabiliales bacterium]
MKSSLYKIFALFMVLAVVSCSKDSLRQYDLLQQKNAVESLNDPYLLSSILKQTSLFYQNMGYGASKLPSAVQHMGRNVQGGDNTYQGFKQPTTDMYDAMNILKFIDASIKLADARGSKTHVGIFTTFRVLLFSFMTDYYGDVYYTQALQGREGILYPEYDKQADIYKGLLAELDAAAANISAGTDVVNTTYDLMFAGDKTQWLKFCNSVKLRLLIHESAKIADAGAQITSLLSKPLLTDAADKNASIAYVGTTAVNSWIGGSNNWAGGGEFERRKPCKTLVDKLLSYNDPRAAVWFAPVEKPWTKDPAKNGVKFTTTDPNGFTYTSTWEYVDMTNPQIAAQAANIIDWDKVYVGFIAGMLGDFKNGNGHYDTAAGGLTGNFKVSMFSKLFQQNAHALLRAQVMNKDEIQFTLAEAAAKGLVSGNADTYYRTGITYSMKRWGVSDAAIATYLAQPSIALPSDLTGKLIKIAEQKWIALFSVASENYLEVRRNQSTFAAMTPNFFNNGNLATFKFPQRYRYPTAEQGQNVGAYNKGVATLVPAVDDEFSKMWLLQ